MKVKNLKFKIKNYSLKLKVFFIISLFTFHFSLFTSTALAVESTPSSDIKAKVEELKKEIASRAAKLKAEVTNKLKDKAYVGKVKTDSTSSITLATKTGPKIVNLNQDTEFVSNVKNKKFSQQLIAEEDFVATLGDVDETGVLTARRVILLPPPSKDSKTYLWGQIVSISDKLVTLKTGDSKNVAVSLTDQTQVKNLDVVILTGSMNKNDVFEAEFVYVIPQSAAIKPKKTATPSATPTKTASPSASPKTTPKPTPR